LRLIGGRNNAAVHRFGSVFGDPLVLFLLKAVKQLALQVERNLPDLIEKASLSIRRPETTDPILACPRERSVTILLPIVYCLLIQVIFS
jgi:hypothetical protein